jgi:adenylate kinase family enzyme
MAKLVLLLSGPIACGKSELAKALVDKHHFKAIKSGVYLQELAAERNIEVSRRALQEIGDDLDEATNFDWIVERVAGPLIAANEQHDFWLMDSVRKERQVEHFRHRYGDKILHVHLSVPEEHLKARYDVRRLRPDSFECMTSYEDAVQHPNEVASRALISIADVVLTELDAQRLLQRVAQQIFVTLKA